MFGEPCKSLAKRTLEFNNQTFYILYFSPLVISFYIPVILSLMLNVKAGAEAHCLCEGETLKKKNSQEEKMNALSAKLGNLH